MRTNFTIYLDFCSWFSSSWSSRAVRYSTGKCWIVSISEFMVSLLPVQISPPSLHRFHLSKGCTLYTVYTYLKCNFEIPNGFLYYGNDFEISKLTRLHFKCVCVHPLLKWDLQWWGDIWTGFKRILCILWTFYYSSKTLFVFYRSVLSWYIFNYVLKIIIGGGEVFSSLADQPFTFSPIPSFISIPNWILMNSFQLCYISPTRLWW